MQNRMESNIRDKFLVKMIKLQEFTEKKRIAEMLNEMNPKLKALLAAGLIGTAGLGMQSCSNPSDSVYYPYTVEAPSTDNPGSGGGTVNPGDNEGVENPNPSETEEAVTFKSLGVSDYAESLAKAKKIVGDRDSNGKVKVSEFDQVPITNKCDVYIYRNGHFEKALSEDEDAYDDASENKAVTYICYKESNNRYFVPKSKVDDFDAAIAAYKAAHAE